MRKKIIETFLQSIVAQKWPQITPSFIAESIGVPVEEVAFILPSRDRGFHLFSTFIEDKVFEALPVFETGSYVEKEQAMEIILTKLEVLEPFKYFFLYMRNNMLSVTDVALALSIAEFSSMERIWKHYGCFKDDIGGMLKRKALFGIYLLTMDTWIHETASPMDRTLERLDHLLTRGEALVGRYFNVSHR